MEQSGQAKAMKRFALVLMGCFIAAPLVAAPVLGQVSFRPLTIGHSLRVTQAFGPDDEDCVYVTHRVLRPDGMSHPSRSLVCNE